MKTSEIAKTAIDLADAIRAYWDEELPKRHPHYPMIESGEDSGPPPPEEKQLRRFLNGLPEDEAYKLILLMHLGRSDFDAGRLADGYRQLTRTFPKPGWAVSHMLGIGSLAEYLRNGLESLRTHEIDVDALNFEPVQASKARKRR